VYVDGIHLPLEECSSAVRLVRIRFGIYLLFVTYGSEDCLPPQGDIDGIGASLLEFEILGYPETKQAYYIRCTECVSRFRNPKDENERVWVKSWLEELQQAEKIWNEEETKEVIRSSEVKKECSPSTNTTEEEYFSEDVKSSHVREIIVID
jgi:hypothetical protein